jgi:hypothetical protein
LAPSLEKIDRTAGLLMKNIIGSSGAALILGMGAAFGDVTLFVNDAVLQPNQANQTVEILAQNTGPTSVPLLGVNLEVQVADGGVAGGGAITGPTVTLVDIFSRLDLFGANNNGASGSGAVVPQIYEVGTLTSSGTVLLVPGLTEIGTVTLDTTGFPEPGAPGHWALTLSTKNGDSALLGSDGNPLIEVLAAGQITLVPEPVNMTIGVGALLMIGACIRRIRKE